jgi:hypothetical protein
MRGKVVIRYALTPLPAGVTEGYAWFAFAWLILIAQSNVQKGKGVCPLSLRSPSA